MRAILSVYDKAGIVDFARGLAALGVEILSTGGTKRALEEAKVPVKAVEAVTGFPEVLDGRVKTLHPAIHAGILARRDLPQHVAQLAEKGFQPIDLVVVNLYPFRETVARPGVTLEDVLENIDIGGPTMLRAAAKNYPSVLVVVDPADYGPVLSMLPKGVDQKERRRLAQKAFQHVASYDTAIATYLRAGEPGFPPEFTTTLKKSLDLRYGENPHQQAAFYHEEGFPGAMSQMKQLWGRELSFNNILDAEAAWGAASDFEAPTVAVIKHTNPCGLASHQDLPEAYRRALAGDPVAAFGGIVAINRPVALPLAQEIDKTFYEIVIAPGFQPDALKLLQRKQDLRILQVPAQIRDSRFEIRNSRFEIRDWDFRRVSGGFLVQTPDSGPEAGLGLKTVTQRQPTAQEITDLHFAWKAVKHIKSNAIVLAKDGALLGMGAGQPSRVVSVQIALERAGSRAKGSVLGSDAFFPFPDGVELAAKAGVTAIIEPGGSIRDAEAIKVCDQYRMAMVFTGIRHFRH